MEEREIPTNIHATTVTEVAKAMGQQAEQDWRIFRHGVATEETMEAIQEETKKAEGEGEVPEVGRVGAPAACADSGPLEPTDGTNPVCRAREFVGIPVEEGANCHLDLSPFDEDDPIQANRVEFKQKEKSRQDCEEQAERLWFVCITEGTGDVTGPPTMDEIDDMMENWTGHNNVSRGAASQNTTGVESDAFGLIKPICSGTPMISKNTVKYPYMTTMLNKWAQSVDEVSGIS